MRARRTLVVTLAAGALLLPPTTAHATPPPPAVDLGREVLPPGDGWASYEGPTVPDGKPTVATGTTGGADAAPSEVYVVDTWQELRDALAGKPGGSQTDARRNTVPRIIYVTGTITAFDPRRVRRASPRRSPCRTPAEPFSMADYIAHYDPTGPWGTVKPSGPLENARIAAAAIQADDDAPARRLERHPGRRRRRREDRRRQHADPRRAQRHRPEPDRRRRVRLLPRLGPDRHRRRQLELRLRQRLGVDVDERLGGPQHVRRRRPPALRAAGRLRPAVRDARRAARHHARLRPGDRQLQPVRRSTTRPSSSARRTPGPRTAASTASRCTTTTGSTSASGRPACGSATCTSTTTSTRRPPRGCSSTTGAPASSRASTRRTTRSSWRPASTRHASSRAGPGRSCSRPARP